MAEGRETGTALTALVARWRKQADKSMAYAGIPGFGGGVAASTFMRCAAELEAALEAAAARPQVKVTVSELRTGEENDGPLESTDLFVEGPNFSLLCNVPAGQSFTYSLAVAGKTQQSGTVGVAHPEPAR